MDPPSPHETDHRRVEGFLLQVHRVFPICRVSQRQLTPDSRAALSAVSRPAMVPYCPYPDGRICGSLVKSVPSAGGPASRFSGKQDLSSPSDRSRGPASLGPPAEKNTLYTPWIPWLYQENGTWRHTRRGQHRPRLTTRGGRNTGRHIRPPASLVSISGAPPGTQDNYRPSATNILAEHKVKAQICSALSLPSLPRPILWRRVAQQPLKTQLLISLSVPPAAKARCSPKHTHLPLTRVGDVESGYHEQARILRRHPLWFQPL